MPFAIVFTKCDKVKSGKLKAGDEAKINVKVERLANYQGDYKVEVLEAKGLTVKDANIAANQQEAQLVLRAAGAAPGSNVSIVVRVTGMFNSQPVVQETKLTVNVTK